MRRAHAILGAARFMNLLIASVADNSQRTRVCPSAMRSPRIETNGIYSRTKVAISRGDLAVRQGICIYVCECGAAILSYY
jgi:hypothetical protein